MAQRLTVIARSANHPAYEREAAGAVGAQQRARLAATTQVSISRGLGNVVYRVAHPIGCWLDRRTAKLGGRMAWAKTGLCGCSACSRRRQRWNAWLPDVKRWKGGWQVAWVTLKDSLKRVFRITQ